MADPTWIVMYKASINAYANVTLAAFTSTYQALGWQNVGPGSPGAYEASPQGVTIARVVTGTSTVGALDDVIVADASGGSFTITLPLIANAPARITIVRGDSTGNVVTIAASGGALINGAATYLLDVTREGVQLVHDATSVWWATLATGASSGGGGAALVVQENGSQVSGATVQINFRTGLVATLGGTGQINVDADASLADISAAIAAHVAASDPHSQYLQEPLNTALDRWAPIWDAPSGRVVWEPTILPEDLATLTGLPANQPGMRSLGTGALEALPGNTALVKRFRELLDVYNTGATLRGDLYMDDGNANLIAVPKAIWTSAFGASYTGSALEKFINGSGGSVPLGITTTTLPAATVGQVYTQAGAVFAASGGALPLTWTISTGALPGGLSLNASTGAITGTPTTAATVNFTARVTDALGHFVDKALTIVVAGSGSPLSFTAPTMPGAQSGVAYNAGAGFSVAGGAAGGVPAGYSFSQSGTALTSAGLAIAANGLVTGTPNGSARTLTFNVVLTDGVTTLSPVAVSIAIADPPVTTLTNAKYKGATNAWGMETLTPINTSALSIPGSGVTVYVSAPEILNSSWQAVANPARGYDTQGTGANQGDGSLAHPYATIAKALTVASVANIICLSGIYREYLDVSGTKTIMAKPGSWAWCFGTDVMTGFTASGSIWAKSGYDMTKLNRKHAPGYSTTIHANSNGVNVTSLTGTQSLTVVSTAGDGTWPAYPTSGRMCINRAGSIIVFTYTALDTSVSGAHRFLNCTLVSGTGTLVTGDVVGNGDASPYAFYDELATATAPMAPMPDQVFINGRELKYAKQLSDVTPGTWTFWVDPEATTTSTLYISENPTGASVEVTTRPGFMTGTGGGGGPVGGSTGSQYMGLGFFGYGSTANATQQWAALMLNNSTSNNWKVSTCLFAHCGYQGISIGTGTGHTVDNCLFLYNGTLAGHANASNIRVSKSRIMYNNWKLCNASPSSYNSVAAWKIGNMAGMIFYDCICDDNYSNSLWSDVNCTDVIMVNCLVQRNAGYGPNAEIGVRPVMLNCVITDNDWAGIKIADASNATANSGFLLWNCTTVGNGKASTQIRSEVFLYDDPRSAQFMDQGEMFNMVMCAATSGIDSILKTLDNSVFALSKTTTGAQATAATYTLGNGHTFTATCTSGSTVLTIVSVGTLVYTDHGQTITGPQLQASTVLTLPAKVNTAANMLSRGHDTNLYIRMLAQATKPLAKAALPLGVNTNCSTMATLRTNTGGEASSVLYDASGNLLTEVFVDPTAQNYHLTSALLAVAPTPTPLSAELVSRINAIMSGVAGWTALSGTITPAVVGASDALGVQLGFGALPKIV